MNKWPYLSACSLSPTFKPLKAFTLFNKLSSTLVCTHFVPAFSQRWLYSVCGGVPHVPLLHVDWAFCTLQFAPLCRVLHSHGVSGALIFSFACSLVVCLLSEGWLSSSVSLQWIVNPWERRVVSCKKIRLIIFCYFWHVAIMHEQKPKVDTCLVKVKLLIALTEHI